MRCLEKQKGFTLIELLAVAAVIAAATIASTALMLRNQSKTKLFQAAQQVALTVKAARIRAIQSGQPCRLLFNQENRRVYLESPSEEETLRTVNTAASTLLPDPITFAQILILDAEQPDALSIEFQPNGSAKTAVIQLTDGKHQAAVIIHQVTGRVQITTGDITTLLLDRIDLDEEQLAVQ